METQFTKREYSTKQVSLLTKAMLIAGAFFLIIGGASYGFTFAFKGVVEGGNLQLWLPIMLLSMLGGSIVSIVLVSSILKGNAGLTFLGFFLYTAIMSVVFGYLFALLQHEFKDKGNIYISIAFGVTAAIFFLSALIAKLTSLRGIFTMGKLIMGVSIAMSIMMIVFLILGIVGVAARSRGTFLASQATFNFIMIGMCLISFLYIVIDIWQISKASEFAELTVGEQIPATFVWYCGYRLLVDLLSILVWVIIIIFRYARRRND